MSSESEEVENNVTAKIPLGRGSLIYLARHGETPANISKKFADPMTEHLTERGQHQAQLLGDSLANVKFTRVYASNYPRAIETARIALGQSKHSKDIQITVDERIREREDEKFIGLSYDVGNALRGKGIDSDHPVFPYAHFHVEGTEPVLDILPRQESFFDDLFEDLDKSESPETILIVTHGYFITLLMTHLNITDKYEIQNWVPELIHNWIENCGYHVLDFFKRADGGAKTKNCWDFIKIHQSEHLEPAGFVSDHGASEKNSEVLKF